VDHVERTAVGILVVLLEFGDGAVADEFRADDDANERKGLRFASTTREAEEFTEATRPVGRRGLDVKVADRAAAGALGRLGGNR
jgi:hypothetical protein